MSATLEEGGLLAYALFMAFFIVWVLLTLPTTPLEIVAAYVYGGAHRSQCSTHGPSSNTMALITSDSGQMAPITSNSAQMALITLWSKASGSGR